MRHKPSVVTTICFDRSIWIELDSTIIMRTNWCATVFLVAVSAFAADTSEFQNRRQRAATTFGDGILMVHARSVADDISDGFRQDPAFYYFTGLENTSTAHPVLTR